jgi:prepilin-type processing-associated H-X9-DG protein
VAHNDIIAIPPRLRHIWFVIPDGTNTPSQRGGYRRPVRADRGFSLLELLIVMAIIITLFTLYWSGGSKAMQMRQIAACNKNLQHLYGALNTYSIDNSDKLPALADATTSEPVLSLLVPRCTTGTEYFICPGTHDSSLPEAQPFADRRISYAYYMGHTLKDGADQPLLSDRQVNNGPKLPGQSLFSADGKAPGANHNKFGGNVMFCDGNVQSSGPNSAFTLTNGPGVTLLNPKP